VRVSDRDVEILGADGAVVRRYDKAARKGSFVIPGEDRVFNPSRDVQQLLERVAQFGPSSAKLGQTFAQLGRRGQKQLYGFSNLVKQFRCEEIEAAAELALAGNHVSYASVKETLEQRAPNPSAAPSLKQSGPGIREISE